MEGETLMFHRKTADVANGKWKGILLHFGVSERSLTGKHSPCPICDGRDRFRFDNLDGKGTSICSYCGARDGMKLAMDFTGRTFVEVASEIDGMCGNIKFEAGGKKVEMTDDERIRMMRETFQQTQPIEPGDLAHRYLSSRNLEELSYPKTLRFAPKMRDGEGGIRPALAALVGVYGEAKFSTIHRTFLKPDGSGKAEMESPRKLMPGSLPDGACVVLSDYQPGQILGIAEGIETAMSASNRFGLPVWAAINATMLSKWQPPEGCEEVLIFGDNDASHTGHAVSYALSRKLRSRKIRTEVHIPEREGEDWADVYMREAK